jgi:hypothetical protein
MRPAWCGRQEGKGARGPGGRWLKGKRRGGARGAGCCGRGEGGAGCAADVTGVWRTQGRSGGPVQEEDSARVGLSGGEGKWARPKEAGHFSIIQTLSNEFELIRLKYVLPVVEKIQIKYVFEYY